MLSRPTVFQRAPRLFERFIRLVREVGRDLKAHISVAFFGLVVDGAQRVGGVLNVLHRDLFEDSLRVEIAPPFEGFERFRVVRAAGDRFLENCRVGRHAAQAVFTNQAREFAGRNQAAANVIQPYGLTEFRKRLQPILARCCLLRSGNYFRGNAHRGHLSIDFRNSRRLGSPGEGSKLRNESRHVDSTASRSPCANHSRGMLKAVFPALDEKKNHVHVLAGCG